MGPLLDQVAGDLLGGHGIECRGCPAEGARAGLDSLVFEPIGARTTDDVSNWVAATFAARSEGSGSEPVRALE
jgi:hypothetical protein